MSYLDLKSLQKTGGQLRNQGRLQHDNAIQEASALIEYSLGQEPFCKSSIALAADMLFKILRTNPRHSQAHALMGYILFLADEADQAYFHLQKSLISDPENLFSQLALSQLESYKSIKQLAENETGQTDELLEQMQERLKQTLFVYGKRLQQLPLQFKYMEDLEQLLSEIERVGKQLRTQISDLEAEHNIFSLEQELSKILELPRQFRSHLQGLQKLYIIKDQLESLAYRLENMSSQSEPQTEMLEHMLDELDLIADLLDQYADYPYSESVIKQYENLANQFEDYQEMMESR